jgi:hypothetical protein
MGGQSWKRQLNALESGVIGVHQRSFLDGAVTRDGAKEPNIESVLPLVPCYTNN